MLYFAFIIASLAVMARPGPDMLAVLGTSVEYGWRKGIGMVTGLVLGVMVWVIILALLVPKIMSVPTMNILRIGGIIYIASLSIKSVRERFTSWLKEAALSRVSGGTESQMVAKGFIVSLVNPLNLMFLVAFFPQFVHIHPGRDPQAVIFQVGATFCLVILVGYTYLCLGNVRIYNIISPVDGGCRVSKISSILLAVAAVVLIFV